MKVLLASLPDLTTKDILGTEDYLSIKKESTLRCFRVTPLEGQGYTVLLPLDIRRDLLGWA